MLLEMRALPKSQIRENSLNPESHSTWLITKPEPVPEKIDYPIWRKTIFLRRVLTLLALCFGNVLPHTAIEWLQWKYPFHSPHFFVSGEPHCGNGIEFTMKSQYPVFSWEQAYNLTKARMTHDKYIHRGIVSIFDMRIMIASRLFNFNIDNYHVSSQ